MTKQSEIFLAGEGDAWHQRNNPCAGQAQHLMETIRNLQIKPRTVLEYGCGTGWRLEEIRREHGSVCFGIDPSEQAISLGEETYPKLSLVVGTAKDYPLFGKYDLIIFGFCLYLIDRDDLFHVVEQADAILAEYGYLAIHDFDPEFPQVKPYHHKPGVFSYKMDHAKLWLANPAYELVYNVRITEEESITILRKNSWEQFK